MKFVWESESIKQIIPDEYLFYYEYVPNSPKCETTSNLIN